MILNASTIGNSSQTSQPLYNSRIMNTFVEYLDKCYPSVKINDVFEYADITKYEVDDSGHWFSQRQADRFHEIIVEKTGNENIARDAGRYITSAAKIGPLRKFALGMINPANVYLMIGRLSRAVSRGAIISSKKLSPNKVEIISTPTVGTDEKPYQCENRLGTIESLSKLFTDEFADVEHPSCIHRGDDCCRYLVSWKKTQSYRWRKACNIFMISGLIVSTGLSLTIKPGSLPLFLTPFLFLSLLLFLYAEYLQKKEQKKIIYDQGDVAKELIDEINTHHSNAVPVQEVGRAISTVMDIDKVIERVLKLIEKHLNFDRGMIMIADDENTFLRFKTGYGYSEDEEKVLKDIEFRIDDADSVEALVKSFKKREPFVANSPLEIKNNFSKQNGFKLVEKMGIESFVCVPIAYKEEPLGLLFVENIRYKKQLVQSEINLLEGIASQTAVSIVNATSFQRIQENEEKYRLLAENATDVIWVLDMDLQKYTYVSPAITKLIGYKPVEIMAFNLEESLPLFSPEITVATINKMLEKAAESNEESSNTWTMELEIPCKDGSNVFTETSVSLLDDPEGTKPKLLGITRDISERKKADKERQQLESQLQQSQKMESIGTLAGGIAHDFNNILGIILGNTEMSLKDIPDGNRAKQTLEEVRDASLRAKDMIQQLLSFGRKSDYVRKPLKIIPDINESLKFLRSSIPRSVKIKKIFPEDSYTILADQTQIHQIMINLCSNAFDAMEEDGGLLTVQLADENIYQWSMKSANRLAPGQYVKLSIIDTGHGMSSDTIKRIFEPYFTTKDVGKGTGMGLAVVHGIVEKYGGHISVESEIGKGTVFNLWLPAVDKLEEKPEPFAEKILPRGTEHILYVDDEESMARMGQMVLERLDYQVKIATGPAEALDLLQNNPESLFKLVVTDFSMPGMTGRKLAEHIFSINPDLPVILCTGFSEQYIEKGVSKTNIQKCLEKPFNMSELASAVREVLDSQKPDSAE